jgi:glycosyltransferase involved in cell wall biosynthesis
MKILHVFDMFSTTVGGGTVAIIQKVSRALAEKGHEVVIFTSDYGLDRLSENSVEGVRVVSFRCISRIANFFITPSMIGEVRQQLKDYDIVHLHCFRSFQNIVIHHYALKYGVPYVIDAHGSVPRTTSSGINAKWLLKWLFDIAYGYNTLRDATRVIAETEDGFKEYRAMGVGNDKIVRITPPFDIKEFAELPQPGEFRKKYNIKTRHIVMFLGRIHWIKGISFLVDSFSKMSETRDDAVLVIAGPDDGYLSHLQKQISKLNISEKVLFTGFIGGREKLAALVDADVVVQTSIYEQGTGVPFEAVLCNTPIIVSGHTVASANVREIDGGYLVEHGNIKELADTIEYVLSNLAEAGVKTRKAAAYIKENLSLEKGAEKYEKLYEEAITAA